MNDKEMKIGILVVAYNAASTLAEVLNRIPADFKSRITEVIVSDDHSQDSTYLVGIGYQQQSDLPIEVIRQPKNLGYGGNQKVGYRLAIERGFDIIVLLHGDGQYAPECLPDMVAPIERGETDAVFGSRMMVKGSARKGGMPLYKFVGNRILTTLENAVLGTKLSEFHSGYRAYSVRALSKLPFEQNSDGFNFDTQIIIQMHDAGKRIVEIPIPTYYGDEICRVNGMQYAADVMKDVIAYRFQKAGFGDGTRAKLGAEYQLKDADDSSHGKLFSMLEARPPGKILDLGCSGGLLGERLQQLGYHVMGVDVVEVPEVHERLSGFVLANLDAGIPAEAGSGFDLVLAADVLEHVREPEKLLRDTKQVLRPGGTAIICVPNISHWYPRFRTAVGRFDYDQRGILDHTHLRFFTRRSIRRLVEREGFKVRSMKAIGLPLATLGTGGGLRRLLRMLDQISIAVWPAMFGYQFILEIEPVES